MSTDEQTEPLVRRHFVIASLVLGWLCGLVAVLITYASLQNPCIGLNPVQAAIDYPSPETWLMSLLYLLGANIVHIPALLCGLYAWDAGSRSGRALAYLILCLMLISFAKDAFSNGDARYRPGQARPPEIPEPRTPQEAAPKAEKPVEKWPVAFSLENIRSVARIQEPNDSFLPLMTEDEANRLLDAYGYDLCLRVAAAGAEVKAEYDRRFGPAIDNIIRVAQNRLPSWENLSAATRRQSEERARNTTAEDLPRDPENVPPSVLETLLIYHPDYQRNPAGELRDGFKKEYVTDGTGKSDGIKLRIDYPVSWKAEPGVRPHIVQKFRSQGGRGFEEVMLLVGNWPRPPDMGDAVSQEDLIEAAQQAIFELEVPGMKTLDSGQGRLAGTRAFWTEYEGQVERLGIELAIHGVQVGFVHGERLVMVTCNAHAAPRMETVTAGERFLRVGPAFLQMLNSFDFLDRYRD